MKKNVENYFGSSGQDIAIAIRAGDLDAVEFTYFLLDCISAQNSPIFLNVTKTMYLYVGIILQMYLFLF